MAYTGLLLASLGSILILVIGWYILQVVAYWQIFEKAGEPGWKAIIPCYTHIPSTNLPGTLTFTGLYYSEP